VQPLFKLKLCSNNIATTLRSPSRGVRQDVGESKGEMQRAIENVETACGMPTLIQARIAKT